MIEIGLSAVMLLLGLIAHFLKHLMKVKKDGGVILTPRQYWVKNPYHSSLALVGAVAGFIALLSLGQLTPILALGLGYMADSVPDAIGSRTLDKLKG